MKQNITVVGAGRMGSALARAFAKNDSRAAGWARPVFIMDSCAPAFELDRMGRRGASVAGEFGDR